MNMPIIKSYVEPPQANAMKVAVAHVTVWFSYTTPVAFQVLGKPVVVQENTFGTNGRPSATTAKHLNAIDRGNKDSRLNAVDFHATWTKQTEGIA